MRIALGIEYNGRDYYGWQAQAHLPTIQGYLEAALSIIADEPIKIICAGRTDAGVHAIGQVIHFDTEANRSSRAWILGTNSHLPDSISVRFAESVDDSFHARFSAIARRYRYIIHNHMSRPAILTSRVTWHYDVLNVATMQEAGQYLLGEQDFSSFRSAECESKTPMRNVHSVDVFRSGDYVVIDIQANAFLHHMVRNIVGVLMRIGAGFNEPEWMQTVLAAKDRRKAADTAPAAGLYLTQVFYPLPYSFPERDPILF